MTHARRGSFGSNLLVLGLTAAAALAGCADPDAPLAPNFAAGTAGSLKAPSEAGAVASSESQITLNWRDNSTNETGFEVHRSTTGPTGTFSLQATTAANVRTWWNGGLSPLTQYCYRIRAFRVGATGTTSSSFSNTTCATTLVAPNAAIADTWAYAEVMTNGYGQVCHDTGSFVFSPNGSGFIGMGERTGNCVSATWFHQEMESPGKQYDVQNGTISGTSLGFEFYLDRPVCRFTNYGGTLSGNPPDRITGGANCGWWSGTWEARRRPAVASVTVLAGTGTLVPGNTRQLLAIARAADGLRLIGRTVNWSSANPAVATVSSTGVVLGKTAGLVVITATIDGQSASVQVAVNPVRFTSVSVGPYQSCGVTTLGKGYCWGYNGSNGEFQLGDGTRAPGSVAAGFTLGSFAGGYTHTCAVTTAGAAYCWGKNFNGAFGSGTGEGFSSEPVPVAGGITFSALSAGYGYTCGLTPSGSVYCWGTYAGFTPTPLAGGLGFAQLDIYDQRACGLTPAGAAYCWGAAGPPSPAGGSLVFTGLSLGGNHDCGLVSSGTIYCWGFNQYGQLGSPPTGEVCEVPNPEGGDPSYIPCSTTPVPVSGQSFVTVSAGSSHTCGLNSVGAAYCWGDNTYGQLGNGSTIGGATPVAVAGGHSFTELSTGSFHTCGLATDGAVYCWGLNANGQVGNGTTVNSLVPVKVLGQ